MQNSGLIVRASFKVPKYLKYVSFSASHSLVFRGITKNIPPLISGWKNLSYPFILGHLFNPFEQYESNSITSPGKVETIIIEKPPPSGLIPCKITVFFKEQFIWTESSTRVSMEVIVTS